MTPANDSDGGPPSTGEMHWLPIGDWVEHTPYAYCPCKPTHDKDFNEYMHHAADGREFYEAKGWVLD